MQSKYLLLDRALRNARRDVWVERDLHWAQWLHRVARYQTPVKALVIVSKLGDGLFWYVLIAALALFGGTNGRDVAAQMFARHDDITAAVSLTRHDGYLGDGRFGVGIE